VTSRESPPDLPRPPPSSLKANSCPARSLRHAAPAAPSGRAGPRAAAQSGLTRFTAARETTPSSARTVPLLTSRPGQTASVALRAPARRRQPATSLRLVLLTRRFRRASDPTAPPGSRSIGPASPRRRQTCRRTASHAGRRPHRRLPPSRTRRRISPTADAPPREPSGPHRALA
jgi:hypothetical protein